MSSDASKSHDFQLVAFYEQMGAQFGTSVGVPLQPPRFVPSECESSKTLRQRVGGDRQLHFFHDTWVRGCV